MVGGFTTEARKSQRRPSIHQGRRRRFPSPRPPSFRGEDSCRTKPIRTTGGTGGMRKAPKRGHRVTNRTCNPPGLPASRGLLPLEMLTYRLFLKSPMRTQLAVDGFLAKFWYHRHPALPHRSLTLPFFPGSSPGPGGAFLKGNYLPKNTHETAEPCECSPAVPVVNGKPICGGSKWVLTL